MMKLRVVIALSSLYLLITNETRSSPRKKRARISCLSQRRCRRAKCKMACVALKSSSSEVKERTQARRYIFYFVRHSEEKRAHAAFLKQRHCPLWFMPRLSRSFLIPASYVNNLSCNRPSESKTNGIAFGKLLAWKTYRSFYFCFKNSATRYVFYLSMSNTKLPFATSIMIHNHSEEKVAL